MFSVVIDYLWYGISMMPFLLSTALWNLYHNFFFLVQAILALSIISIVLIQKNPERDKTAGGPRGRPDIITYITALLGLLLAANTIVLCMYTNKIYKRSTVTEQRY